MIYLTLLIGLPSFVAAAATLFDSNTEKNASSPCAAVGASVSMQHNSATPTVAAQLAYDCINTVPFNQSAALSLLDGLVPYIRWQSNTVWLKNPPKEYVEKVQSGVDIWGGMAEIRSKVVTEAYHNEFEFGFDLYTLFQSTHDGHFVYIPDVIGTVFNWARPVPLVSISSDGKKFPKPFVYTDVLSGSFVDTSFVPLAITKINGRDVYEYLEDWSQYGSLQDRDALYNNLFYELAAVSRGSAGTGMGTFSGGGRGRWVYPGPETILEFENKTTVTYTNYAKVLIPFDGITDGKSLYNRWFAVPPSREAGVDLWLTSNSTNAMTNATTAATAIIAPGYPPPVIREESNLIGGYFLEDNYSDIAVLSVPSFGSSSSKELNFQDVAMQFLDAARTAGKSKLIIDLQANGGGVILQGYDLYKQLFPTGISHAAGDRFRAFEETHLLGEKFSAVARTLPRVYVSENDSRFDLQNNVVSSVLNHQTNLDANGKRFPNWDAMFGPDSIHGDNFTELYRWDLSDVLIPINSGGIYIHGYGNLTNLTQPFSTENIVVLTDGYCASTCTIFSELMRQRAGVSFISLGGRSKPGITQAVGGSKGTGSWSWQYIQFVTQYTVNNLTTSEDEAAGLRSTALGEYASSTVFSRAATNTGLSINFSDGVRDGDESDIPLQFLYEPADCRILYTKEMTIDMTAIWKAVADTAWAGMDHCVAGNLENNYKKKMTRKEKTASDHDMSKQIKDWRKRMHRDDYPLDVFTNIVEMASMSGDAISYP
ncbi:hypothetical protein OPT61_g2247 [Boeremia exigua]|uniref:Uncharacterized protein n=1 Tax=Boeremia exigua TaxID=749465 RepID=A0ACC2IMC6_9PLEO|nr:hypothetical protein OPT61_g2247 [Boeremia exigua]